MNSLSGLCFLDEFNGGKLRPVSEAKLLFLILFSICKFYPRQLDLLLLTIEFLGQIIPEACP